MKKQTKQNKTKNDKKKIIRKLYKIFRIFDYLNIKVFTFLETIKVNYALKIQRLKRCFTLRMNLPK